MFTPANPEQATLVKCHYMLVQCVQQSPNEIGDKLISEGILSPEDMQFLRRDSHDGTDKARKIVDTLTGRVEYDVHVFNQLIEVMKSEGQWAKYAVDELIQKYQAKSTSAEKHSSSTTLTSQDLENHLQQQPPISSTVPIGTSKEGMLKLAWDSYRDSCVCGYSYERNSAHCFSNSLIVGGFVSVYGGEGSNFRI